MRGRFRQFFLLILACAVILVLLSTYRKSLVGDSVISSSATTSSKDEDPMRRPGSASLLNINALMPGLTQPEEHLERMRQHERQMLDNVREMIRQREQQRLSSSNDGDGNGAAADKPDNGGERQSLWKGIINDDGENNDDQDVDGHGARGGGGGGGSSQRRTRVVLGKRFVHLDLKGARPTMDYVRRLFPFLRSIGSTGVLIEYEDTFPYWGRLNDVRAVDSFSAQEIAELNRLASDNGLDVIPLVQTFGHMEFVLKSDTFKSLREIPAFPQAICPTQNETLGLVREMIDQLVALHPNARHLHIGCDEVYNVGECPLCQERMERLHWTTEDLLGSHVRAVARHVHDAHGLRAIVWDDMFRKVSLEAIRESQIGRYADVLVWKYQDDVDETLPAELWRKYADVFDGIWIASAFKGASKPDSYATDVGGRLSNHVHWMEVVQKYGKLVPFAGIVLTGWQRFDHFAALCELLPAGIPSLAVNLRYLQSLEWSVDDEERVRETLGCNLPVPLHLIANGPEMRCNFPGSRVFELALRFHTLVANLDTEFFESNYVRGWVSEYNVQTRFSSPALLEQAALRYADGRRNLTFFRMAMESALTEIFDRPTVVEWIDTYVKPLVKRLEQYNEKINWLLVPNVWPRRPLYAEWTGKAATQTTTVPVPVAAAVNNVQVGSLEQRAYKQHAIEP